MANFSRNKVWNDEKLTDTDLNAEFDNILNNLDSEGVGSSESTAANAREQSDPGTYASPNIASSTQDQIEYLRFAVGRLIGGSNASYLDIPATTLEVLADPNINASIALEFEGQAGGASSTSDVLAKFINQGGVINALSLSSADVVAADFDSTNVKFGNYSYSLGSGNVMAFPFFQGNPYKGTMSCWFRNTAAGDYLAYNPQLGLEVYFDSVSGRLTSKVTEKTASGESAKNSSTVQGSSTRTGNTDFQNAIFKWRLNDEAGASTDLLNLKLDNADEGTQLSAQDLDINAGDGGYWFIGAQRQDPTWDHFYAAAGLPTAHSSAWTSNGTPNGAVSNGVLNIATTSTNAGNYSRTDLSNLPASTVEIKCKVNSVGRASIDDSGFAAIQYGDDSVDRGYALHLTETGVLLSQAPSGKVHMAEFKINTKKWHVYRVVTSGTEAATDQSISLYIDGCLVYTGTLDTTDASVADEIRFGDTNTTANVNCDVDIEYVAISDSEALAPVAASSQGQIDSFGIASSILTDAVTLALQSASFSSVVGSSRALGPLLPPQAVFRREGSFSTSSTNYADISEYVYYIPCDGVTPIQLDVQLSAQNDNISGATVLNIDIGDDINGGDQTGPNPPARVQNNSTQNTAFFLSNRRVHIGAPGLIEVRPNWRATAGSSSINTEAEINWTCLIPQKKEFI